jgi:hypothetical protein
MFPNFPNKKRGHHLEAAAMTVIAALRRLVFKSSSSWVFTARFPVLDVG